MMHHDYPLPAPEILDYIETSRRADVPEEKIKAELETRGLAEAEIAAALAPGATVCSLAESSPEMIPLHSFGLVLAYGIFLGAPAALAMARHNSRALRGQDRLARTLKMFLIGFCLYFIAAVAALALAAFAGVKIYAGLTALLIFIGNLAFSLVIHSRVRRAERAFREDAQNRDELAPADVMLPLFIGLVFIAVAYGLAPYLVGLA